MRITLLFVLILAIALSTVPVAAQEDISSIQAPETVEEAQKFGLQILQDLPAAVQKIWKTYVVPFWTKIWSSAKNIWDTKIFSWIQGLWDQVLSFFEQEIEKRKPLIEEEFKREKEELKQELKQKIPEPGKTLWDLWDFVRNFFGTNEEE